MRRTAHPATRLAIVLSLAALLLGAALTVRDGYRGAASSIHAQGHDDAYISYRYARNLVAGHGLVYNPGERVEGYSNFLHVLLAAALLPLAGAERLHDAVTGLNLLFLALAFAIFVSHARRALTPPRTAAAALLFALQPLLWIWSASGLETILVLALQLGLWAALERALERPEGERWRALALAVVMALCLLARADGFVFVALALVYLLWRGRRRLAFAAVAASAPVAIAYWGWRRLYYGNWWPNTYYAKVPGPPVERLRHGVEQLAELAVRTGLALPLAVIATMLAAHLVKRRRARDLPFGAFFVAGLVGYWLYVGGDHLGERFLLVAWPLAVHLLLERAPPLPAGRRWLGGVALAALAALQLLPLVADPRFSRPPARYDGWLELGRHLGTAHSGATLAIGAAGKVPYASGLRTIDMRGLADRHIARLPVAAFTEPGHDRQDPDYVLARRPELIAGWIDSRTLDLNLGLPRERYHPAGYRLRYLANAGLRARPRNVVDIRELDRAAVRRLIEQGYRFAVLESSPEVEATRGRPDK